MICTLGAQGIIYFSPGVDGVKSRSGYLPAAKVLNGVKDTTGAGDCFAGYFAAGLMRGEDLELALQTCLTVSRTVFSEVVYTLTHRHAQCALKSPEQWRACRGERMSRRGGREQGT